jgi:hypothetical protein
MAEGRPKKLRTEERSMTKRTILVAVTAGVCLLAAPQHALAQKQGGTMRTYIWDNPPSGSIHEEATISTVWPFMSVFNNPRPPSSRCSRAPATCAPWR